MAARIEAVSYGSAALEALRSAVAEAKRDDTMRTVTVIVPNNIAGIVARRHLAQGGPDRPGIAAIEVLTLPRLAERSAAAFLAPRRPTTRTVLAAAWRRTLADVPGRFAEIAVHPATVRALTAAHAELRDLSPAALDAVEAAGDVSADVVRLHRIVMSRLAGDWYDSIDLLRRAAEQIETRKACVLYLPQPLNQAEQSLVAALADSGELTIIAGLTGARRADESVEGGLGGGRLQLTARIRTANRMINASDSDDEVRAVVRDVMLALDTTPAHRIAILYSALSPYARLLHEQLQTAGVAVNGAGVRPANERAVARVLLEVLALIDQDLPRGPLFRALANAPVRDFTGERIPLSGWERMSRSAGIVAGDDWAIRLDAYVEDRQARLEDERRAEEPREWLINRLDGDCITATALRTFATTLRSELARANAMTTWSELGDWCRQLFSTLVGDADALRRLPAEEQYAVSAIFSILNGLESLDGIDTASDLQTLRDALDTELAATLPRVGRFGDGIFVGPLSAAIGLDLDVVYVVGLSEDLYPGRMRADALLPDRVREATSGELPARSERLSAQFRHLLAALASADQAVVSFPRGDLRRSSRRLPSRWLLPSLRALSGEDALAATDWDHTEAYGDAMRTSGSFAGALLSTPAPANEQEWRTREAAAAGRLDDVVVESAVAMIRARASDELTRFDGNLAGTIGLPNYAVDDRAVSPTSLEDYAKCPHGYFVQRLLGVQPQEQPEDLVVIAPNEIGNLIHGSVEDLITEFKEDLPGPGEPWTAAQHQRLVEIAVANAEAFRDRGLTGHPRLWERERERIIADAARLLADDDAYRRDINAGVVASELAFGLRGQPPVEVAIPGGRVIMRGSADRVDQGADGTLYVTDIKTGSSRSFDKITQDDPLVDGTKLQLPVYAYAARQRFGSPTTPVSASYSFVRRDRKRIVVELTPEVERAYARTLSVIVRSISAGLFPPKAPDKPDFAWTQCVYCNPDGIGHAENRERWEHKRSDPALRELLQLIEPEAVEE